MRSILLEPVVHFFVLGTALFVLFQAVSDSGIPGGDDQIEVSAGRIEQLASIFTKTWQRPPTTADLERLVDDFILEEAYYRAALAMGIDRDDTIIRRRLRQKVEFLTDDLASAPPTDDELAAYLAANADRFRSDTTYTFQQIYINPDRPTEDLDRHVREQLEALRAGRAVDGDGGLLPRAFEHEPRRAVTGMFGADFATRLDSLPTGSWQSVESGLGVHLIRLDSRHEGTLPALADVKARVQVEWQNARRIDSRRAFNARLLERYRVVVDWPGSLQPRPRSP